MSRSLAVQVCVIAGCCLYGAEANGKPAKASHQRLETEHGPIHVWTPANYDAETAGVVVYVHGFYTNVDRAWRKHRLPAQFAESAINALFIACEAPARGRDPVRWESIGHLLAVVAERVPVPDGRIVAVGHSGAHRTLSRWIGEDVIDTLVLVDAYYGDDPGFHDWLAASPERRLIDAAHDTRPWTDELHASLPDTVVYRRFPSPRAGKLRDARDARVVYVRSQHDHMRLVTGGVALPMLLRALRLPVVADRSRKAPIRRR